MQCLGVFFEFEVSNVMPLRPSLSQYLSSLSDGHCQMLPLVLSQTVKMQT